MEGSALKPGRMGLVSWGILFRFPGLTVVGCEFPMVSSPAWYGNQSIYVLQPIKVTETASTSKHYITHISRTDLGREAEVLWPDWVSIRDLETAGRMGLGSVREHRIQR